ncbi:MAG: F0F1 ATP synthase subunit B [Clostridiales bacterium]|nr:F0F1 ATP synthase subunit B [Clostridiales bacterium]
MGITPVLAAAATTTTVPLEVAPLMSFNWTFVFVLVSFFVLYLILKKFFFEKIHDFMQAREQKVIDQFDNAETAQRQAEARLTEYNEKMSNAENERRAILKEAKTKADERAQQVLKEASEKAQEIIRVAQVEAERERAAAALAMKDQIATLAIYAAERILEKNLDEKEQMLVIDELLADNGAETWTH